MIAFGSMHLPARAQFLGEPAPAARQKQSVPLPEARASSEQLVNELFQTEAANSRDEKLDLAQKLLQTGLGSEDDPADQFALFDIARRMAAGAGDLKLSFAAVDHLASYFEFEPAIARVDCLRHATAARGMSETDELVIAKIGGDFVESLIESLDFENAKKATTLMQEFAKKSRDAALVTRMKGLASIIKSRTQLSPEVEAAKRILESNPDDAEANLAVGEHLLFLQGDVPNALKMLSRCSDRDWQQLAEAQATQPTESADQIALADRWWALALKQGTPDRTEKLKRQAAVWYTRALPNLAGLTRRKAEHRSEPYDIGDELAGMPESPKSPSGTPIDVKGPANRPDDAFFQVTPAD